MWENMWLVLQSITEFMLNVTWIWYRKIILNKQRIEKMKNLAVYE